MIDENEEVRSLIEQHRLWNNFSEQGKQLCQEDLVFGGSDFCGLDLSGAEIPGADFTSAKLASADFSNCNLASARFVGALLLKAKFLKTKLDYSDFTGASLLDAYFFRAHLFESTLEGVNATGADFRGAYFVSANLCGANLSQAQFNEKTCFKNTIMFDVLLCGATGFDLRADESIIIGNKSESQLLSGEQAQAWLLDRSKIGCSSI